MSTFYLGMPLTNIDPAFTDVENGDGTEDRKAWAHSAFHEMLWELNEEKPGGLTVTFQCSSARQACFYMLCFIRGQTKVSMTRTRRKR